MIKTTCTKGFLFLPLVIIAMLLTQSISAAVTHIKKVSVGMGNTATSAGASEPHVSDFGDVVFESESDNLTTDDYVSTPNIYFVGSGENTTMLNLSHTGGQPTWNAFDPAISADGRYVAFYSFASNLVPGDTNDELDVFVRDLQSGTTSLVSVSSTGLQGNGSSMRPVISPDGRYIGFMSDATNLVSDDTNSVTDLFLHDRIAGTTERVNLTSTGLQTTDNGFLIDTMDIGSGGRYVAFTSQATGVVSNDTNAVTDVFLRDRELGTTTRVSISATGLQIPGHSTIPQVSDDGRYIFFATNAGIVEGDDNGLTDLFIHDRQNETTQIVTVTSDEEITVEGANNGDMSADGRYVVFDSVDFAYVEGSENDYYTGQIFVRDVWSGTTVRVSETTDGDAGDRDSYQAKISPNGQYIVFESIATNLSSDPNNEEWSDEIFLAANPLFGITAEPEADTGSVLVTKTLVTTGTLNEGDLVQFLIEYSFTGSTGGDISIADIPGTGLTFHQFATSNTYGVLSGNNVTFLYTGAAGPVTGHMSITYRVATGDICSGTTGAYTNTALITQSPLTITGTDSVDFTVTCEIPEEETDPEPETTTTQGGGGGGSRGFATAAALAGATSVTSPDNAPAQEPESTQPNGTGATEITVIKEPVIPMPLLPAGTTVNQGTPLPTFCPDSELQAAYDFAAAYSITTMPNCYAARLEDTLMRKHAAKMIVNFAINVLDKKPDEAMICTFTDLANQNAEVQQYAKIACQLGLMGLTGEGEPSDIFNPEGPLDKAQFSTILSRLLYGDAYNTDDACRYCGHIDALYDAGVITIKDDISMPFLRGRAMLMMMRVQK